MKASGSAPATPPATETSSSGRTGAHDSHRAHFKDEILDRLARDGNVAQFVSFSPEPELRQRHAWIAGFEPNHGFDSLESSLAALLRASPEGSVNVRSYEPDHPKSREFLYGRTELEDVAAQVRRLAADGLFTIVNETIDVHDGGVSGVAFGDVVEFAPGDTPRCVEQPGTAALPRDVAFRFFRTVYGFEPALPDDHDLRVEFSLHPLKRGFRADHTVIWEIERVGHPPGRPRVDWPNRFSRFIGDKAFGLLLAHLLGLPVPRTLVIPRMTAPFSFGRDTGLAEPWIRTCPTEQIPGLFTTQHGWRDPYRLMQEEDPEGTAIASLLHQQGVHPAFSGALVTQADGNLLIEGVAGRGEAFMVGKRAPEPLPEAVESGLRATYQAAFEALGPVRFEWVHDGERAWVLQLHHGASQASGRTIFPGDAERYHRLEVSDGIDALRELIARVEGSGDGIILIGAVGVTSHFGDLLRRARIPSHIEDRPPA